MNPRLVGVLDAFKGNKAPADRRGPLPFEGLDRLAYWQGKREAEQNAERQSENRGRSEVACDPRCPIHAFTLDSFGSRARDLPSPTSRPARVAVVASAKNVQESETSARSRLRQGVGR